MGEDDSGGLLALPPNSVGAAREPRDAMRWSFVTQPYQNQHQCVYYFFDGVQVIPVIPETFKSPKKIMLYSYTTKNHQKPRLLNVTYMTHHSINVPRLLGQVPLASMRRGTGGSWVVKPWCSTFASHHVGRVQCSYWHRLTSIDYVPLYIYIYYDLQMSNDNPFQLSPHQWCSN